MTDSSSDEHDDTCTVLYRDREEWKDVTPVPQDDGPHPIVELAYSEQFRDVYDYFRAVLKSEEKSERVLQLTQDAIDLNPANYTVWQYRRELIKHLQKDLVQELQYVKALIERNPKNYQVWHHRRVIVEWLQDPVYELEMTESILDCDAKNYHAWQHRQWVMSAFQLFDNELEYVDKLLQEDVRNNSAWNQRYFVLKHTTNFSPEVIEEEVAYTLSKISVVTKNESAWNYLRGVLQHSESGNMGEVGGVRKFCEDLYESGNRSSYLLGFMVDMYAEEFDKAGGDAPVNVEKAIRLCDALAKEHDTIRKEYWNYLARCLAKKIYDSKDVPTSMPSGDSNMPP